jgi:hypothetical protein
MAKRSFKKRIGMVVLGVAVLAAGLFCAPRFLVYSTGCERADAVVVLLGPVFNDRDRHARDLMNRGMADYLVIPAYQKVFTVDRGKLKPVSVRKDPDRLKTNQGAEAPSYYEDTHLELIEAKRIMRQYGQTTAIFVSSPYHMRRIRMMVGKEYGSPEGHCFLPTPSEKAQVNAWELKASDWKKVGREYVKIAWFLVYSPWVR